MMASVNRIFWALITMTIMCSCVVDGQGECFTQEGIPGTCTLPESCRFPAAIKTRLFRSQCFTTISGRRGICCPGTSTVLLQSQVNRDQFDSFQATPAPQFVPQFTPQFAPQQFNQFIRNATSFTFRQPQQQPFFMPPQSVSQEPDRTQSPSQFIGFPTFRSTLRPSPFSLPVRASPPTRTNFRFPAQQQQQQQSAFARPPPVTFASTFAPPADNLAPLVSVQQPGRFGFLNANNDNNGVARQPTFQVQQLEPNVDAQNQVAPPPSTSSGAIASQGPPPVDCPDTPTCFQSKYRTVDGSCNNLRNPNWGKAFFAFPRLMTPAYADGISTIRVARDGGPLPSSRLLSASLVADANVPDAFNTAMIMSFGQFLDHDITRTAISKGKNNTGIACCRREMLENPSLRHPECFPIDIPTNDRFYGQFNQTCMEFVRSLEAPRPDCVFGPREQMNQITSFIDASNIYGSSKPEGDELRTFQGGKLTVSKVNGVDLLPFLTIKPDFCSKPDQGLFCFKAGDSRCNEQISLAVLHTVWMREHNRIADELARINSFWSDENIYQEARRIVGAELQHVTYNEFLPVLLGRKTMQSSELILLRDGFTFQYDETVNPSITNEFATAAYRFGHTLIPATFMMFDDQGAVEEVPLREEFNRPFHLFKPGGLDKCIRGLCTQRSQKFDNFITKEVTEHLFERNRPFGLDLVAINLQRGRDHGLPGYNTWRQFCGLRRASSFDDLIGDFSATYVRSLKQLYGHVDDIDPFVAGIAEKPLSGAKLGPIFACVIADQFKRLKKGDRFWYESGQNSPFTQAQLQEIRKSTLARVLCDNSDGIREIQQFVFFSPARGNSLMPCSGDLIPRMNLAQWTNEPV